MKLQKPNFKLHFRLSFILWFVFVLAILLEAGLIYYVVSQKPDRVSPQTDPNDKNVTQVDLDAYGRVIDWLDEKGSLTDVEYDLTSGQYGRDNPFSEF